MLVSDYLLYVAMIHNSNTADYSREIITLVSLARRHSRSHGRRPGLLPISTKELKMTVPSRLGW